MSSVTSGLISHTSVNPSVGSMPVVARRSWSDPSWSTISALPCPESPSGSSSVEDSTVTSSAERVHTAAPAITTTSAAAAPISQRTFGRRRRAAKATTGAVGSAERGNASAEIRSQSAGGGVSHSTPSVPSVRAKPRSSSSSSNGCCSGILSPPLDDVVVVVLLVRWWEGNSQVGAQACETAPEVALDRAERDARLFSDSGLREVGVEGQFDDLADSWLETVERSGDQQPVRELVLARHPRLGLRRGNGQLAAGQRGSRRSAVSVEHPVPRDAEQPGAEAAPSGI